MKGFLKFLLLAVVEFAVGIVAVTVLSLLVMLLSQIGIGRALLSIINDGYVSEVVTIVSNLIAYLACALLASKLKAYKPYRALCIVGSVLAVYSIVSSIIHDESFISYIIRLVISLVFFFKASYFIDK